MNVARAGDRALLIDVGDVPARELHAYAAAARNEPGVIACTPGQRSLFVVFDHEPSLDFALRAADVAFTPRVHEVEVRFDGEDFAEFLAHARIGRDEFLRRIPRLTARYLGFRGGWAYLDGWPREWAMPRRATSRPVKRGSFAVAGAVAGFYTIDTPGGWNLLGRTDRPLDIAPGDEIVIVPTEREMDLPPVLETPSPPDIGATFTGNFATIVTKPFDPELAAAANRLVGNRYDAPLLECAMVGPNVRLQKRSVVAWTGAESDLARTFEAEGEINVGRIRKGLRGWLAIGSTKREASLPNRTDRLNIRVLPGPHETPLRTIECEVTPQLNRVGIRLRPVAPLNLQAPADLPSCGMQFGTIQLHPDGSLVAMGPDHPVTGGYLQPLTV
ncbi:MAG TPA: carboxyltransferase domain-containing protein, partial [Thermoanaerobaculia bacterium]